MLFIKFHQKFAGLDTKISKDFLRENIIYV